MSALLLTSTQRKCRCTSLVALLCLQLVRWNSLHVSWFSRNLNYCHNNACTGTETTTFILTMAYTSTTSAQTTSDGSTIFTERVTTEKGK